MAKLRDGKAVVQAIVKDDIIEKLDRIAKKEVSSRSAVASKIIEENIDRYIGMDIGKESN